MLPDLLLHLVNIHTGEIGRGDVFQLVEPENRNLYQDSPLPGDTLNATICSFIQAPGGVRRMDCFQDSVVSRDPIRGNDQEVVRIRSLVDAVDFAFEDELRAGQVWVS